MSVCFAGVNFKNPIVPVSGTFGFGREYGEYFDLSRLGGICVKGLTLAPRNGNKPPRVAETPMGMLNSVGLQNPGVEAFLRDELPFLRQYNIPVIANISGNTIEEYAEMAEIIGNATDLLEVNVSCPNVKAGGMAFGTDPDAVIRVTSAVKSKSKCPVIVKLTPNVTDITVTARAARDGGADALSLINTVSAMRIDVKTRRPVLHMNTGGLSGPAVLPIAVRAVWQVYNAVDLPVFGMGGVSNTDNALEMMLAGASLVGIGTAMFADPYAPVKIINALEGMDYGEITGGVIAWE